MFPKGKAAPPCSAGWPGETASSKQFQPNTHTQNWQRSFRRMIKRVLVRMAVLGLIPVFVVEAILERLRHD